MDNKLVSIAPVRRSVIVPLKPDAAFALFAGRMGSWWLKTHTIAASGQKEVVVEPRVGGRWYEIGESGEECDWGRVEAWEPPRRLVLIWQLDARWRYNKDIVTEVEITFTPEGSGTRVDLVHGKLESLGAQAADAVASFESDNGWSGLLAAFVKVAGV